jgi:hypothetical protein
MSVCVCVCMCVCVCVCWMERRSRRPRGCACVCVCMCVCVCVCIYHPVYAECKYIDTRYKKGSYTHACTQIDIHTYTYNTHTGFPSRVSERASGGPDDQVYAECKYINTIHARVIHTYIHTDRRAYTHTLYIQHTGFPSRVSERASGGPDDQVYAGRKL